MSLILHGKSLVGALRTRTLDPLIKSQWMPASRVLRPDACRRPPQLRSWIATDLRGQDFTSGLRRFARTKLPTRFASGEWSATLFCDLARRVAASGCAVKRTPLRTR